MFTIIFFVTVFVFGSWLVSRSILTVTATTSCTMYVKNMSIPLSKLTSALTGVRRNGVCDVVRAVEGWRLMKRETLRIASPFAQLAMFHGMELYSNRMSHAQALLR